MKTFCFLIGLTMITINLVACGQKGALYLPQDPAIETASKVEENNAQDSEKD